MKLSTRQYHYRLQHLASTCKFSLFRSWSRSQITNHSWVHITQAAQVYALRDELTLQKLFLTARSYEQADRHAAAMENDSQSHDTAIQAVKYSQQNSAKGANKPQQQHRNQDRFRIPFHGRSSGPSHTCRNCGGFYPHKPDKPCPARGITCHSCGKVNHFAKYCLSTWSKPRDPQTSPNVQTHTSRQPPTDNDPQDSPHSDYAFQFHINSTNVSKPTVTVVINNNPVLALIDTGASVMMMSNDTYCSLNPTPHLVAPPVPVYAYMVALLH